MSELQRCPDSIDGTHGLADVRGKCPWCGIKYTHATPRPESWAMDISELTNAYGLMWDPDYGTPGWWRRDYL